MTKAAEALLREALRLEVSERADLVTKLLASLDSEPEEEVQAAWNAEIQRRVERIDAGTERLLPWEEVEPQLDKDIQSR